ncbi:MAG: SpoIID/LytB domain-containing protein [Roseburia sp.]
MKKNWKRKIDMMLSVVIITILLPLFITIISQRMRLEQVLYGGQTGGVQANFSMDMATEARVREEAGAEAFGAQAGGAKAVLGAEEELVGIVAKEIGVDAQREAILAQCVIARTNLYDARKRGTAEPGALGVGEMRDLWGADFEKNYRVLENCVAATKDEVLLWDGDYAYAAYHAISAGYTRDVTELYEEAEMPYLAEKECGEDTVAKDYLSVSYFEREEFLEECRRLFAESEVTEPSQIEVQSRDDAGYVEQMKVGQTACLGEDFRSRLGLNSACFAITEVDDKIRIVTKGLGHGFGLSQNTAECMAEEGKGYGEILAYFYPGTELKAIQP